MMDPLLQSMNLVSTNTLSYSTYLSKKGHNPSLPQLHIRHLLPPHASMEKIHQVVEEESLRRRIEPGTAVGIIAAQSFSERLTQATLNSFHTSGTKDSPVAGMKSVLNMLDATHFPGKPLLFPYKGLREEDVIEKAVSCICSSFGVLFWPMAKNKTYAGYFIVPCETDLKRLSMHLVKQRRNSLVYQVDHETLVWYNFGHSVETISFAVRKVLETPIYGIIGVESYDPETGFMQFKHGFSIAQNVTIESLFEATGVLPPNNLQSNDLYFMEKTYGIEITRCFMVRELCRVLAGEGIYIDQAHIDIIVDNMMFSGTILPNTRYGVEVSEGIFARASFETAYSTFVEASFHNLVDNIHCPSSEIMLGKATNIGSMYSDVVSPVEKGFDKTNTTDFEPMYSQIESKTPLESIDMDIEYSGYVSDDAPESPPKRQKILEANLEL